MNHCMKCMACVAMALFGLKNPWVHAGFGDTELPWTKTERKLKIILLGKKNALNNEAELRKVHITIHVINTSTLLKWASLLIHCKVLKLQSGLAEFLSEWLNRLCRISFWQFRKQLCSCYWSSITTIVIFLQAILSVLISLSALHFDSNAT